MTYNEAPHRLSWLLADGEPVSITLTPHNESVEWALRDLREGLLLLDRAEVTLSVLTWETVPT